MLNESRENLKNLKMIECGLLTIPVIGLCCQYGHMVAGFEWLSVCLDTFPKVILTPKPRFHTKTSKHSIFLDKLF